MCVKWYAFLAIYIYAVRRLGFEKDRLIPTNGSHCVQKTIIEHAHTLAQQLLIIIKIIF